MSLTDEKLAPAAIEKCPETWGSTGEERHRCVLIAGHGIANPCVHFNGTVVEGHLYALYGEDLSPEIRTQIRLDHIKSLEHEAEHLRAALSLAKSDAEAARASCGADTTGAGAYQAVAAVAELERIRRELSRLSERLEDTFMGGYSDPRDLEIFRHGMGTAATCVEAVLRGERNQAPIVRPLPEGEPAAPVQVAAAGSFRAIWHHGDINIIDDDIGAGIAWTKSTTQAKRICEALAAPAPGVVLSAEERRAIRGVHHWLRGRGVGVNDEDVDPAADVLERLLAASPRPATLTVGEREAVSRARHLISSFTGVKDTQAVLDGLLASDKLDTVPPRAGALCRAAIKWREWARKLERTAPEDADEELIAAVDEFLGIPSSETP